MQISTLDSVGEPGWGLSGLLTRNSFRMNALRLSMETGILISCCVRRLAAKNAKRCKNPMLTGLRALSQSSEQLTQAYLFVTVFRLTADGFNSSAVQAWVRLALAARTL